MRKLKFLEWCLIIYFVCCKKNELRKKWIELKKKTKLIYIYIYILLLLGWVVITFNGSFKKKIKKIKKEKRKKKETWGSWLTVGKVLQSAFGWSFQWPNMLHFTWNFEKVLLDARNIHTVADFVFKCWIVRSIVGRLNPKTFI